MFKNQGLISKYREESYLKFYSICLWEISNMGILYVKEFFTILDFYYITIVTLDNYLIYDFIHFFITNFV